MGINLLCTQAKLENDNKSVTVRDSMRLKAERGDFPGLARPGYINNRFKNQGQRDISPHPVYFSLMRKYFDLALTGKYGVKALIKLAEEMGIRNYNGNVIGKSSMHRFLRDPFYTGKFIYKNKLYKGNHKPLLSEAEFNLLQDILDGKGKGKFQKHSFALKGTITCGQCKYCVTVETHTRKYQNGNERTFAYYRCSKKSKVIKCNQGYIAESKAETQIKDDLTLLELESDFAKWAYEALEEIKGKDHVFVEDKKNALQTALDAINKRITNLTDLKISPNNVDGSLLSDEEFAERKRTLLIEKEKIMSQIVSDDANGDDWGQIARDTFDLGLRARQIFDTDVPEDQKVIVKMIWSNRDRFKTVTFPSKKDCISNPDVGFH